MRKMEIKDLKPGLSYSEDLGKGGEVFYIVKSINAKRISFLVMFNNAKIVDLDDEYYNITGLQWGTMQLL